MSQPTPSGSAREAALHAFREVARNPEPAIAYRSAGRVLIVGDDDTPAREALARLAGSLTCLRLIPVSPATPGGVERVGVPTVRATVATLEGYLGAFRLTVQTPAGPIALGDLLPELGATVDLVLDLGDPPLLHHEVLPPGYFAPGADREALESALAELPGLVGELEKPTFFRYDPDRCAHARSGIVACRRCIEACPAEAITSIGERVAVDPNLCHGVGVCATTCPTGAIRYAEPHPGETLDGLRALLRAYRQAGATAPVVLFHGRESGASAIEAVGKALPDHVVPVELEEVGSAGLEVWLATLAYGAAAVRLLVPVQTPASARRVLDEQVQLAVTLLQGMGYAEDGVAMLSDLAAPTLAAALPSPPPNPPANPAGFAGLDDKRAVARLALDHLYRHAPARRPLLSLPAGAPFGEVWLDATRCTLCMACVSQCPGKALLGGEEGPQLRFIEDNCVQCGLCGRSCPENAIGPSPRYLFDPVRRQTPRVLKEEPPFHCIRCGKPFGTRSMIDRMTSRLAGHSLFLGAALERLQMCEDCRVRAIYEAEVAAQAAPEDEHRDR